MEISFKLDFFLLMSLAQSKATEYKDKNPVLTEQSCETVQTDLNFTFIGAINLKLNKNLPTF